MFWIERDMAIDSVYDPGLDPVLKGQYTTGSVDKIWVRGEYYIKVLY